jgi:hypothetical protein
MDRTVDFSIQNILDPNLLALRIFYRETIGGARPARIVNRAAEENNCGIRTSFQAWLHGAIAVNAAKAAGGLCQICSAADFSLTVWRMLRLLDSSISARTACRSSVAETTGNSSTRPHPSASKNCNERRPVQRCASRAFRHN